MDVVIVIEGMTAKVDYESKRWGKNNVEQRKPEIL